MTDPHSHLGLAQFSGPTDSSSTHCGQSHYTRFSVHIILSIPCICVLPPSISHLKIECPCVAFVSPFLLSGDISLISSIAQNIANNWAGNIVTCENYDHLWLNKSFSLYISTNIISETSIGPEIKLFLEKKRFKELKIMFKDKDLLKSLLPNLAGVLPHDAIQYVPYEMGYVLLNQLEKLLGGSSEFKPFLKSYLGRYAFESITTDDWKEYLYHYFSDKVELLDSIKIQEWLYGKTLPTDNFSITAPLTLERVYTNSMEEWIRRDASSNIPLTFLDLMSSLDLQKIVFLNLLYDSHETLTVAKLNVMSSLYDFDKGKNGEIRLAWLRLCIKSRWEEKVPDALEYAIQFSSSNYACSIFQHLSEWPEKRVLSTESYIENRNRMLHKIQDKLESILRLD